MNSSNRCGSEDGIARNPVTFAELDSVLNRCINQCTSDAQEYKHKPEV